MAVPEQIRKQAEAIDALYANVGKPKEDGGTEPVATPEPVVEPVAAADYVSADSTNDGGATPAPASEHGGTGADAAWEQRYRTLQGMFNAENARSREAQSRIDQLERLMASLQEAPAQQAPAPAAAPKPLVTDAEREEYGDSIEVMRKVSREELTPFSHALANIQQQLQGLSSALNTNVLPQVQRVAQQQSQSREERFWTGLAAAVPDWQQINNSPAFQSWLLEVDPLTGSTRQAFLEKAQGDFDVNRVVAFFHAYAPPSGTPATNAQPNRSASELEKQIAPGRARSSAANGSPPAKTYTKDDIAKFFDDVRSGKYKGREPERDRIERDIFAAQREGRINAA